MGHRTLAERSGLSKNSITEGMKALEDHLFIQQASTRRKHGEFGTKTYAICNPSDGEPLSAGSRNFFHSHGIRYSPLPNCIVLETSANWSLAQLSGSEVKAYVALCWFANKRRDNRFATTWSDLKSLAAFATTLTTEQALEKLTKRGLVSVSQAGKGLHVELLDPYTGEPLHRETGDPADDPANYYHVGKKGRAKRLNLNGDPEQVVSLLESCLPDSPITRQGNGSVMICCPFHPDSTPSCSVDPVRRGYHCFGCRESGPITKLITELLGISRGEAIQMLGRATGAQVEYHPPDRNAEAIYSYWDKNGRLVKQVLRFPGKQFKQRRPAPHGDWVWGTIGVSPILYNADRLQFAETVCICEGEKDCNALMALSLHSPQGGDVVATTSGGSDSWMDTLADDLLGKRVALMPDDDEPGQIFAHRVAASLDQRGIEYRVVKFSDVGAKDISEFIHNGHTKEELVERVGGDWLSVATPSLIDVPTEYAEA